MKYKNIKVKLTEEDGNAFHILGKVSQALKKNKVPAGEIEQFMKEAQAGDYDNLLVVCMNWVDIE